MFELDKAARGHTEGEQDEDGEEFGKTVGLSTTRGQ